jgi:hypothetical protein
VIRGAPRRRGIFLVEMIAVISASIVILAMAAALIGLMLQLEREQRAALTAASGLGDLAHVLRADAHAANTIEIRDQGQAIEMKCSNGDVVTYKHSGASVVRETTRDGSTRRRETYRPGRHSSLVWSLQPLTDTEQTEFVTLEVRRPAPGGKHQPSRLIRIEAVVGRDARRLGEQGGGQ